MHRQFRKKAVAGTVENRKRFIRDNCKLLSFHLFTISISFPLLILSNTPLYPSLICSRAASCAARASVRNCPPPLVASTSTLYWLCSLGAIVLDTILILASYFTGRNMAVWLNFGMTTILALSLTQVGFAGWLSSARDLKAI